MRNDRKRVLLTTTSFQDTPGEHHSFLEQQGYELVQERGPLPEERLLQLAGNFDAFLCGDDAITRKVIERSIPRLKAISKYGVGLDKVDVSAATAFKIPVTFCPGVNHTTVAEHTFALLLAVYRQLVAECNYVKKGEWKRLTGHELMGKTMGLVGMGRIGKEVAVRARAFGMKVLGFGTYWDDTFARQHGIDRLLNLEELLERSDVVSLHTSLREETRNMINKERLSRMKRGAVLINCARGELVDTCALADALKSGHLWGYGADVMEKEPPPPHHPLFECPNTILTPHIGSRTHESVVRQARMAVENLVLALAGQKPLAQANHF